MISKEEFIRLLRKAGTQVSGDEPEFESFETCANIAEQLKASMPGIGFGSNSQRMNCFHAVCRHLDEFIDGGEIDIGGSQIALMILRLSDKRFLKASTMFDIRGSRMGFRERAEMPASEREYLAGLKMLGS